MQHQGTGAVIFLVRVRETGWGLTDFKYFSTVLAEHQLSLSYATQKVNNRCANKREIRGRIPQLRS
jgi:hypothetical protein